MADVSIIIPFYNRLDHVVETLRLLSRHDDFNAEVILVDDCSSDWLADDIARSIFPDIRIIRHKTNLGACSARNSGIDAASTSLVAFLDSDDAWLPKKLSRQIALAQSMCNQSKFLLSTNMLLDIDGTLIPHNYRGPHETEALSEYLLLEGQAIQTSTLVMPTFLARQVRFRDGLPRHQDWDFVLRCARAGIAIVYDDLPLVMYNMDDNKNRISFSRRRLAGTLCWFKLAEDLLTSEAMVGYFIRSIVGRDGILEFGTAAKGLAWLIYRRHCSLLFMLFLVFKQGVSKARSRLEDPLFNRLPLGTANVMKNRVGNILTTTRG